MTQPMGEPAPRIEPLIGDVITVRTTRWPGWWVRFAAAIEARPGGVGWANAQPYLDSPYTMDNSAQGKTDSQRAKIADAVMGMLGTPYDWRGIAADGMIAINARAMWLSDWQGTGQPPAQVVCSSLAAWVYREVGLQFPMRHPVRFTTPADWQDFIISKRYNVA
jgi:cell wall-associated NlpC family hydrolase